VLLLAIITLETKVLGVVSVYIQLVVHQITNDSNNILVSNH